MHTFHVLGLPRCIRFDGRQTLYLELYGFDRTFQIYCSSEDHLPRYIRSTCIDFVMWMSLVAQAGIARVTSGALSDFKFYWPKTGWCFFTVILEYRREQGG